MKNITLPNFTFKQLWDKKHLSSDKCQEATLSNVKNKILDGIIATNQYTVLSYNDYHDKTNDIIKLMYENGFGHCVNFFLGFMRTHNVIDYFVKELKFVKKPFQGTHILIELQHNKIRLQLPSCNLSADDEYHRNELKYKSIFDFLIKDDFEINEIINLYEIKYNWEHIIETKYELTVTLTT